MRRKKLKPVYLRIRMPLPAKTGGTHASDKGGKYRRNKEKEKIREELKTDM